VSDLGAFLVGLTPAASEQWHWPTIGLDFDVTGYLTTLDPPLELVVSVRAIARRGGEPFLFESEGQTRAIPGGRREPGESPDAALVREIPEETGCAIVGAPRRLGILHLRSLTPRRNLAPRPEEFKYRYPDSLQWVFVAELAGEATPSDEPFVDKGRFVPVPEARALLGSAAERTFLEAALATRSGGSPRR
jgi:8-oxo-dGTP pyrophosphatase MutT (NUDIX family)